MKQEKQEIVNLLSKEDNFLVTTFETDKIEAIASLLAMGAILNKLGKNFYLFVSENPKTNFSFLPNASLISDEISGNNLLILLSENKAKLKKMLWEKKNGYLRLEIVSKTKPFSPQDVSFTYQEPKIDYLIVLGSSRFVGDEKLIKYKDKPVINIDYHKDNNEFGKYNWLDDRVYSMAEMLVSMIEAMEANKKIEIKDKEIATLLYAAILWRSKGLTGKVPPKSFSVVAQLLSWGAKKTIIDQAFWQMLPAESLTLLGAILESVEFQNGYFIFSLPFNKWSAKRRLLLDNMTVILDELKQRIAGMKGFVLILEEENHKPIVWSKLETDKISELAAFVDWEMQTKKINRGQSLINFSETKERIKKVLF